ncbi:MAG: hypothetical protein PF961_15230 [Planctomycetota bacterium]|jgi:hypothetical protein|nr:hypothetical protein [Planctomycetota bacterium]
MQLVTIYSLYFWGLAGLVAYLIRDLPAEADVAVVGVWIVRAGIALGAAGLIAAWRRRRARLVAA